MLDRTIFNDGFLVIIGPLKHFDEDRPSVLVGPMRYVPYVRWALHVKGPLYPIMPMDKNQYIYIKDLDSCSQRK
jgi:hypothetical protein